MAVFSICMPAIWLISLAALTPAEVARSVAVTGPRNQLVAVGFVVVEAVFIAVPLLLGWRGRPRAGAVIALLPAAYTAYVALSVAGYISPCWYACMSLLYAGEAAALVASPGPRRGAARMNFPCWAITIATGLAFALWEGLYSFASERNLEEHAVSRVALAILIAIAVTAGFMLTLPRPVARRLLLLFAAPAWLGMVGTLDQQAGRITADSLLILYLPALTLAGVTIVVAFLPAVVAAAARRAGGRELARGQAESSSRNCWSLFMPSSQRSGSAARRA